MKMLRCVICLIVVGCAGSTLKDMDNKKSVSSNLIVNGEKVAYHHIFVSDKIALSKNTSGVFSYILGFTDSDDKSYYGFIGKIEDKRVVNGGVNLPASKKISDFLKIKLINTSDGKELESPQDFKVNKNRNNIFLYQDDDEIDNFTSIIVGNSIFFTINPDWHITQDEKEKMFYESKYCLSSRDASCFHGEIELDTRVVLNRSNKPNVYTDHAVILQHSTFNSNFGEVCSGSNGTPSSLVKNKCRTLRLRNNIDQYGTINVKDYNITCSWVEATSKNEFRIQIDLGDDLIFNR